MNFQMLQVTVFVVLETTTLMPPVIAYESHDMCRGTKISDITTVLQ